MKTKILLASIILTLMAGCKKNAFTTKPQLQFKSANTSTVAVGQILRFILEITDSEGDIQDSMWVQKVVPNCSASNLTAKYKMPNFTATKNLKADIEICFGYGNGLECPPISQPRCNNRNDSATYRFWVKDKAGNISDTVSSKLVVIIK